MKLCLEACGDWADPKSKNGSRCVTCEAARIAGGHSAAYKDRQYRRYRAQVQATRPECHLCGELGADSVDHVVPLNVGGSNGPENWAPAHLTCNASKGDGTNRQAEYALVMWARRGNTGPGTSTEHGTRAHYVQAKCRCVPCRRANSEYETARRRGQR